MAGRVFFAGDRFFEVFQAEVAQWSFYIDPVMFLPTDSCSHAEFFLVQ